MQILNDLRRTGLVESARGAAGGYLLARPPEGITLRQVVEAVEPAMLQNSVSAEGESGVAVQVAWAGIASQWVESLERVTVEEIAIGLGPPMFFI